MRLLLDTQVFLWLQRRPARLAAQQSLLSDVSNELIVSAVVAWEIAVKYRIGKLPLPDPPDVYVPRYLRAIGGSTLAVEQSHALAVGALPLHHHDPFDRLLVAQANLLGLTIVTADHSITQYDVPTVFVG